MQRTQLRIHREKEETSNQIQREYQIKDFKVYIGNEDGKQIYCTEQQSNEANIRRKLKKIKNEVTKRNKTIQERFLKFNEKYQLLYEKALIFNDPQEQNHESIHTIVLRLLGFKDLIPLLLDTNIEEFYFSSYDLVVTLDHKYWGRCQYERKIDIKEVNCLIRHAELDAEMILQPLHPSLKVAIQINNVPIRISIDGPPLSTKGYLISIRKQKKKPFTLNELLEEGTITIQQVKLLKRIVNERKNIIIVGEPNSGKTTLAQALLFLTPEYWKIICIEDTSELSQEFYERSNVWAIEVPPLDSKKTYTDKKREILKLLHRSPDYVFIGEVQSPEHSKAMFEMLSAGLKGIQTIHSDSLENLLKRWVFQHNIALEQLLSLDYIILMERKWVENKIIRGIKEIIQITPEIINNVIKTKAH